MMNLGISAILEPRHGRPPKVNRQFDNTRQMLIHSGLKVLTETGYLVAGIETVIRNIDVPKESFHHCSKSKEAFGLAMLSAYDDFFTHKLDKFLLDNAVPSLERMAAFMRHAGQGMEKYQLRHGCLVGNLLQEAPLLPDTLPGRLEAILTAWESRVACCLHEAQAAGTIACDASPNALTQIFRIGWEGAMMRAGLCRSAAPFNQYWKSFTRSMTTKTPAQDGVSADNLLPTRNTLS